MSTSTYVMKQCLFMVVGVIVRARQFVVQDDLWLYYLCARALAAVIVTRRITNDQCMISRYRWEIQPPSYEDVLGKTEVCKVLRRL